MLKARTNALPQRVSQRSLLSKKDYRIYITEPDSESEDEDNPYNGNKAQPKTISSAIPEARDSLCTGFHVERRVGYLGEGERGGSGTGTGTVLCSTPLYNDASLERVCSSPEQGYWTATEVAKAGRILARPPMVTSFADEEEMRRIYGLIYDTFRYKHVLQEVLTSVDFYEMNPGLEQDSQRLWLLLFVMILRHFTSYDDQESRRRQYALAGMSLLDDKLTAIRIRLGAAVARLRIKNNALRLSQLLPPHLMITNNQHNNSKNISNLNTDPNKPSVFCWSSSSLRCQREIDEAMSEMGLKLVRNEQVPLKEGEYRFDPVFTDYIECLPSHRGLVTASAPVQRRILVPLGRTLAVPALLFCAALKLRDCFGYAAQLGGPIAVRATAYLAKCLAYNTNCMGLLVFDAGRRKNKYERAFAEYEHLNIRVFAGSIQEEKVHEPSNGGFNIVAALVSPRCSLSAVKDPLDLAIARGGDITVLQQLTEPKIPQPSEQLIEKQKLVLKSGLIDARLDFLLYVTYSIWPQENEDIVRDVLKEMNPISVPAECLSEHSPDEQMKPSSVTYSVATLPEIFSDEDYKTFGSRVFLIQRDRQTLNEERLIK